MRQEAIRVGIQDRFGDVIETVSLDDLVATGDSYQIYLMNEGKVGSNQYELIVQGEGQIVKKIKLGQLKREGEQQ